MVRQIGKKAFPLDPVFPMFPGMMTGFASDVAPVFVLGSGAMVVRMARRNASVEGKNAFPHAPVLDKFPGMMAARSRGKVSRAA
jgi:hypothetical protein